MSQLKVCRICLNTETKIYDFKHNNLNSYYEEIIAIKITDDSLPKVFCFECATLLQKYHKFREKCYRGQEILNELLWSGPLSYQSIFQIDRTTNNLKSPLEIVTVTDKIQFIIYSEEQNISKCNTTTTKVKKNKPKRSLRNRKVKTRSMTPEITSVKEEILLKEESNNSDIEDFNDDKDFLPDGVENFDSEPELLIERKTVEDISSVKKKKNVKSKKVKMKHEKNCRKKNDTKSSRYFDPKYWNKQILKETEAIEVFRARTDDPKYLRAPYKCMDCFKGFSKEEMLVRHKQLRHSESLGKHQCRFCKMRFKWDSHLRRHMREHYTKYQCLRCDFVCPLENTAIFHEEYHSGMKRTCIHCGKEFRHSSTYYTHVRKSHRSEYICAICGVSFVSELGLQRHRKLKHLDIDGDGPDIIEEVSTYCDRCDMHFGTKQAFDEHFFHSLNHTEDKGSQSPKDTDGNEVTDENKDDIETGKLAGSERIRPNKPKRKRKFNNPTTCHQCGLTFDTQLACMKHHKTSHPGTPFTPASHRRICEICGLSLAPGSVASHKNMHTKEKVYACSTCGRQFISPVSLKRHYLTHTGEKPFACALCDKRFTQSNSCKLHYRTFHLKQPYPPRNRNKKDIIESQLDIF